jgi:hypothetical protein
MYLPQSRSVQSGSIEREVLDRAGGLGGDDLFPVAEGEALDLAAVGGPAAVTDRFGQGDHDLFALAADDDVDPGRLGQDLLEHEGGMDAASRA